MKLSPYTYSNACQGGGGEKKVICLFEEEIALLLLVENGSRRRDLFASASLAPAQRRRLTAI